MGAAYINTQALHNVLQNIKTHSPQPLQTKIIAVTKSFSHTAIIDAINHKILCIGENQVQEFNKKIFYLGKYNFQSHLIGHLQSNKINKALDLFDVIETVDSIELANKINEKLKAHNKTQKIYLQINIGQDPNKHGFSPHNIYQAAEKINSLKHLKLSGIMTILPYLVETQDTQPLYAQTRKIQEKIKSSINLQCTQLSMGMSRDYVYALIEGATHIRIGTALYGSRP